MTAFNEYGVLRRVAVCHPREVFAGHEAEWRALKFTSAPDAARAGDQFDAFLAQLAKGGARVDVLPATAGLTLDAIYARDASLVTPDGAVVCRMGKAARREEPAAQGRAFAAPGIRVAGAIEPPGQISLKGGGGPTCLTRPLARAAEIEARDHRSA